MIFVPLWLCDGPYLPNNSRPAFECGDLHGLCQGQTAHKPPLLRIKSGDTVITRTVDSSGKDYSGASPSETGNPLTGPFYIEGAKPGDSIAVHLDKLRLNRNWGYSGYRISPAILAPGTAETLYKGQFEKGAVLPDRSDLLPWDIDLQRQVVNPRLPVAPRSSSICPLILCSAA